MTTTATEATPVEKPKVEKQSPQELGCLRPFALTYKARLFCDRANPEEAQLLRGFLTTYMEACQKLAHYLAAWFDGSERHRLAVLLLVMPSKIPAGILQSDAWQLISNAPENEFLERTWSSYAEKNLHRNLRALAGIDADEKRTTKGGDVALMIWDRFKLPVPTREEFDSIFGCFPQEFWRNEMSEAVQGVLRSYFSGRETVREEMEKRETRRRELYPKAPGFYDWLTDWLHDEGAHAQASRMFDAVRRSLKDVDPGLLRACQTKALLERPDAKDYHPRLINAWWQERAAERPEIVAQFAAAFPDPVPEPPSWEPDRLRRFCSAKLHVLACAKEPHFIGSLLGALQTHLNLFSEEEVTEIVRNVQQMGKKRIHRGWLHLCASKSARDKQVVKLVNEAREYARMLRPVKQTELRDDGTFWPLLPFGQGGGWQHAGEGDEMCRAEVSFDVPAYRDAEGNVTEKRRITVLLRGHLPHNGTTALPEPLEVRDGLTQYRPDRTKPVFGQHPQADPRQMFLKAQAIRLVEDDHGLAAAWCSKLMTEATVLPVKKTPLYDTLQVGDRVAVFCFLPGGSVLGDLVLFEKTDDAIGWRLVTLEEARPRSDAGMLTGSVDPATPGSASPQPWLCKRRPFIRLDAAGVDHAFSGMVCESEKRGGSNPDANESAMSWLGQKRTRGGDTMYKQLASRMERIIAWNRAKVVLIAVGGVSVYGKSRVMHPLRRFMDIGLRSGYLFTALARQGIPWSVVSNRYSRVWMRDFLSDPTVGILECGEKFRRLRKGEIKTGDDTRESTRGSLTHLRCRESRCDLPLNAGWAALLTWTQPRVKELADLALVAAKEADEA